jgi:hypothetical protein
MNEDEEAQRQIRAERRLFAERIELRRSDFERNGVVDNELVRALYARYNVSLALLTAAIDYVRSQEDERSEGA